MGKYSYVNAILLTALGIASIAIFRAVGEVDCTGCALPLVLGIADFIRVHGLRKAKKAR